MDGLTIQGAQGINRLITLPLSKLPQTHNMLVGSVWVL